MTRLLWLRHETKPFEKRVALTPKQVSCLLQKGHQVVIEKSTQRTFSDQDYAQTGCEMANSNSWKTLAPREATILGLKELEEDDFPLIHRHIHFAHAFKNQKGSFDFFRRLEEGGGILYDLEYLVDSQKKRVAAFGKWAGFTGAALALDLWIAQQRSLDYNQQGPLKPWEHTSDLVAEIREKFISFQASSPKVLIIGASGRSGQGAQSFFKEMGITATLWGSKDTQGKSEIQEILDYDILINCALLKTKVAPWLSLEMLGHKKSKLSVLSDISCDPQGPYNPLPIYDHPTTIDKPVLYITRKNNKALALMAIDHLPSLLPRKSSEDFSQQLFGHLLNYMDGKIEQTPWERTLITFYKNLYQHIDKDSLIEENSSLKELR